MYMPFVLDPEALPPPDGVDVVIFPEFIDGDFGIYRSNLIPMKKELAEVGVRAEYAHPPDRRTWLREYSAEGLALNIALGLGTSGAVAILQTVLTRKQAGRVKVKITTARKVRGRTSWDPEFVEFEGTAEEVAALVEVWQGNGGAE